VLFPSVVALLAVSAGDRAVRAQEVLPEARAEIVQIDVVVNDPEGNLVRDLGPNDFEVLEDGKKQRVTHFHFVGRREALPASAAEAPPAAPPAVPAPEEPLAAPPAEAPPVLSRNVLIVVDDLHIALQGLQETKLALRRILDEFVTAQDEVALVSTSGAVIMDTFSRERGPLLEAINQLKLRQKTVAETRGSRMTAAQAEMVLSGDRGAVELAGRNLVAEPGSVYEAGGPRAAVEGQASAAAGTAGMDEAKQNVAENEARRQARGVLLEALRFSTVAMGRVDDAVRNLAKLPGRKICLLVSDGFVTGIGTSESRNEDLQRIIDAATRAGAVVYTLYSRGLVAGGIDAGGDIGSSVATGGLNLRIRRQAELMLRTTLQTIAEQTGGFLIHGTNDFASGLRRMLADNSAYYLMAYEPSNLARDGRFRKIEVKVLRPGKHLVRTRRGYLAVGGKKRKQAPTLPPEPTTTAGLPLQEPQMRELLEQSPPAGPITVSLSADYVDLPSVGPIAFARVKMPPKAPNTFVLGAVYDEAGAPVGAPFWAGDVAKEGTL
jgi:VWFA-related protein